MPRQEADLRQKVVKALRGLDAISVENAVRRGTPDVNYVPGWIEIKQVANWPVHRLSPLRVDHFMPHQRAWLQRRWARGGPCFVLLKVASEILVFDAPQACAALGLVPREVLYSICRAAWHRFDAKEILRFFATHKTCDLGPFPVRTDVPHVNRTRTRRPAVASDF